MDPRDTDLTTLLHDAVADVEPTDRLAEIRQATAPKPSRFGWYAAGGTALAVAATVTAIAVLTNQTSPKAEDNGPITQPETRAVAVYYVGDTPQGQRLYREFHQLEDTSPSAALAELVGPAEDRDYGTYWQPGQLVDATIVGDTIQVEVDVALIGQSSGPCALMCGLSLEQVIYTVQAAAGDPLPVQFVNADGNPVASVFGEPTSEPLVAGDQLDVLSLVNISDPFEGQVVTNSLVAKGRASSYEGTVLWKLKAADGSVVRDGFATASMDVVLKPWETEPIDVSDLPAGEYVFAARTVGAKPFTDTRTIVVE